MNCKPGDLAIVVKGLSPDEKRAVGHICTIVRREDHPVTDAPGWLIDPVIRANGFDCVLDAWLRPIRDNPGNEQFVTEASKSLPRTGIRITERGEVV